MLVIFWPIIRTDEITDMSVKITDTPNKITDISVKITDTVVILLVRAPGVLLSEVRVGTESGFWNRERGRTGIAVEERINCPGGKNCDSKSP